MKSKSTAVAVFVTAALAVPATGVQAQQNQQQRQQQLQQVQDLRDWDVVVLYSDTWSAEEMIGTDVRGEKGEEIGEVKDIIVGRDGEISRVVVEVGGFLEIADQHIGVPWEDVRIGTDMDWVQVPLKEVEGGTYSLYGEVPQGETVVAGAAAWRVGELIGDYASLVDEPQYGLVTDVMFDAEGEVRSVIVDRPAGPWGTAGWYAYPWYGYDATAFTYQLPYETAVVGEIGRFDYVAFAEESEYAGEESAGRMQPGAEVAKLEVEESAQYGAYLTDGQGRTLYMFEADKQGQGGTQAQSNCYDACAKAWPPFTADQGMPQAGQQVEKSLVSTVERKDGKEQVTYNGWPLYYYVKDKGKDEATGQDVKGFGGEWYLLTAEGKKVKAGQ